MNLKRCSLLLLIAVLCLVKVTITAPRLAVAGENEKYLWETPRATAIDPARVVPLREELRREIQRILDAGLLAPLRCAYADLPYEAYWLYTERGRIITTLAYSYPHVLPIQQAGIRQYVRKALAVKSEAPWTPGLKGKTEGAPRALSGVQREEGQYFHSDDTPTLHVLYGLWLYGDRTSDWDTLNPHWPELYRHYVNRGAKEPILYGQMSAHIAIARLAKRFGDTEALRLAEQRLHADFAAGREPAQIAARLKHTRFARFLEPRNAWAFRGQPFIFLDACPEVLRFLRHHARTDTIERLRQIQRQYPLWWLAQAPYFTRWTGDEGVGTPSELFGICYPLERWVVDTPPEKLATYLRSVPTGIGDCYWLEGLVQTIESFGQVSWQDVRR